MMTETIHSEGDQKDGEHSLLNQTDANGGRVAETSKEDQPEIQAAPPPPQQQPQPQAEAPAEPVQDAQQTTAAGDEGDWSLSFSREEAESLVGGATVDDFRPNANPEPPPAWTPENDPYAAEATGIYDPKNVDYGMGHDEEVRQRAQQIDRIKAQVRFAREHGQEIASDEWGTDADIDGFLGSHDARHDFTEQGNADVADFAQYVQQKYDAAKASLSGWERTANASRIKKIDSMGKQVVKVNNRRTHSSKTQLAIQRGTFLAHNTTELLGAGFGHCCLHLFPFGASGARLVYVPVRAHESHIAFPVAARA